MKSTSITARLLGLLLTISIWSNACSLVHAQANLVEKPINEFGQVQAAHVKLRLKGNSIVYRTTEFVPDSNEELRSVIVMKKGSIPYIVCYTEEVDGKKIKKQREVRRTRYFGTLKMARGKYRVLEIPIPDEDEFFGLDGKPLDRKEVVRRIGMKEVQVLTVPHDARIPTSWRSLFQKGTLVLRYKEPLKNQRYVTSPVNDDSE